MRVIKFKRTIKEKDIIIDMCLDKKKNHINIDLLNQLSILEVNIFEKKNTFDDEKIEIKDL